jgi:hypothetical protein
MGHSGSTYRRKKESEKSELFQNRALYHISQHTPAGKAGCRYHEQGNELEEENQSLREKDIRRMTP